MNYLELTKYKLFENIKAEQLSAMLNCLNYLEKSYAKGEIIDLCEADRRIALVTSGAVALVSEDLWGTATLLAVAQKGEVIGETFACGKSGNNLITFNAQSDCTLLFLDYNKVFHTCTTACLFHHRLIENMVGIIADKNYQLMKKSCVVSQHSLRRKILLFLSNEAKTRNSTVFTIEMNRTQLSEYLAADRTALARELTKMKDEGIIDFDKNTFKICSMTDIT